MVSCDSYRAPRCIYSKSVIGRSEGPSRKSLEELECWTENEYINGSKILVEGFVAQRKLRCNGQGES